MRETHKVKKTKPPASSGSKTEGHARRQAAKRDEILAAAREVFFRKGYARASMDDIQQLVGGSKLTLYRYFPSKETLYAEIVQGVANEMVAGSDAGFTSDLISDLRALGKRYVSTLLLPETLELFRGVIAEAPHLPELGPLFLKNGPGRLMESLEKRFRIADESGKWKLPRSRLAAQHFAGMLRTTIHERALITGHIASEGEIDQHVGEAIQTLLHGLVSLS